MIRSKLILMTALVFSLSHPAFADSSVITTIRSEIAGWIAALAGLGALVSGGIWVLGDVFNISWIEHYAQKNKQKLLNLAIFLAITSAISGVIQAAIAKMANPFGG